MSSVVKFVEVFSACPAGREHAAELREQVLVPLVAKPEDVVLDLDGSPGYAASFLEELFGGYVRHHGRALGDRLSSGSFRFVSNEEPYLVDEIVDFIADAENGGE